MKITQLGIEKSKRGYYMPWVQFLQEWKQILNHQSAIGRAFDNSRPGLAEEAMPVLLINLMMASVQQNLPDVSNLAASRFQTLREKLETQGSKHYENCNMLVADIQMILDLMEQTGESRAKPQLPGLPMAINKLNVIFLFAMLSLKQIILENCSGSHN